MLITQGPAEALRSPTTDADVVEVVDFAREHGLQVGSAIRLDMSRMRGVRIDPVQRTARVRAGAVWADVVKPAAAYGLAALAGAPDGNVVEDTLAGGLSWLARKHGLACNAVTAIELVTADGLRVRADMDNDPELFWGLRGGGVALGVVTALEFELFAVEELHAGALVFPETRGAEVFAAWREWTTTVPEEVTSFYREADGFAVVEVAILGGPRVLDPLRALEPLHDLVLPATPATLFRDRPAGEIPHLGGALSRSSVCHGALHSLPRPFDGFTRHRLSALKARIDPDEVFAAPR